MTLDNEGVDFLPCQPSPSVRVYKRKDSWRILSRILRHRSQIEVVNFSRLVGICASLALETESNVTFIGSTSPYTNHGDHFAMLLA